MFNTAFEPLVAFSLIAGVAVLGLNLVLAGLIIALRERLKRQEREQKEFKAIWQPALLGALSGPAQYLLPPLRLQDQVAFLKLWNYMQESLRGDATVRLNEIALQLRCDELARRLLRDGNPTERLLAMLTLGHLRDSRAWAALQIVVQAKETIASLTAARAMIQIDPIAGAHHLMPSVLNRPDWEIPRLARMLGEARVTFESLLVPRVAALPSAQKLRGLQLLEVLRTRLPDAALLGLLNSEKEPTIIAAALRLVNTFAVRPAVLSHLAHTDWRVRVRAVHALTHVAVPSDVPQLAAMLGDSEWWVRYRAAHALVSLPFLAHESLDGLKRLSDDRLGRLALDHVFAERGLLSHSS
ncbi:HEAT repeat-containing protein [Variovorax sp. CF079]|uniref:HEAT repeat domain-containing protein n=1 Tax=Variovorax sp. CF079 TaxID=1882774 RepID=UPI00088C2843|nr:HEAT repeat domain-containing protein [Variovorax sp. CF079]SDC05517.1 HEAT repeat-containing protein [Variovorax sp. CF079]